MTSGKETHKVRSSNGRNTRVASETKHGGAGSCRRRPAAACPSRFRWHACIRQRNGTYGVSSNVWWTGSRVPLNGMSNARSAYPGDNGDDPLAAQMILAAAGDRQAFRAVYDGTRARIFALLCRMLRDETVAGDVMQEVYVSVWQRRESFRPDLGLSPMAWLTAIARNKAIDHLRTVARKPEQVDVDSIELVANDASAQDRLESADQRAKLRTCIEALTPQQQWAIRAAFFGGATYVDLAHRADVPIGTMKSWIRRGLLQLKACMSHE